MAGPLFLKLMTSADVEEWLAATKICRWDLEVLVLEKCFLDLKEIALTPGWIKARRCEPIGMTLTFNLGEPDSIS